MDKAGRSRTRRRGGGSTPLDDETVARIMELHREPKKDGKRRSIRDVEDALRKEGRNVSRGSIHTVIRKARQETLEAATGQVRERIAGVADENVTRITELAGLLADAAKRGAWPDGAELKGMVRVTAAKDAIEASKALLGIVGLRESDDGYDSETIVARMRRAYGLDADVDPPSEASDGEEGTPAAEHH